VIRVKGMGRDRHSSVDGALILRYGSRVMTINLEAIQLAKVGLSAWVLS